MQKSKSLLVHDFLMSVILADNTKECVMKPLRGLLASVSLVSKSSMLIDWGGARAGVAMLHCFPHNQLRATKFFLLWRRDNKKLRKVGTEICNHMFEGEWEW